MVSLDTAHALISTFLAPIFAPAVIFPSLAMYEQAAFDISGMKIEEVIGISFVIYMFCLIGCFVFLFIAHSILHNLIGSTVLYSALMVMGVIGGALMLGALSAEPQSGLLLGGFAGGVSAVIWLAFLHRLKARGGDA